MRPGSCLRVCLTLKTGVFHSVRMDSYHLLCYRNIMASWLYILYSGAVTNLDAVGHSGLHRGTEDVYRNPGQLSMRASRVVQGVRELRIGVGGGSLSNCRLPTRLGVHEHSIMAVCCCCACLSALLCRNARMPGWDCPLRACPTPDPAASR
jgi:hypothetical protein